ncbi:MAG TPA: hypothetical protein DCY95_21925 [Algoriphagus sp.]|jgi:hypothetical protein|uniref:hypothetical protein n=1 Tax=Algoriphagus sp. TaxID=1872435 RepID=UPI000C4B7E21|nr:hypothetical protein [Algoriphagus sp.]MAL13313.1 hypothetical protein [Algoriphagus sp.]MAN85621.1 hypothetical protein [Algoriphagus sp.]HAD51886.1 hypothetical protein [Algoriphagus sp.]HAH37506.1 hypothetical protein [Algoriphagus sp.]HAS57935.1 hypothetical protein [Algoriphagus sp.]|tara:strand:+ start:2562 stop:2864 length:303 start_codon:yes stop_codon:yes gene_type:complete
MSTNFTLTKEFKVSPEMRLEIIAMALMNEFTPDHPEHIQNFWELYAYLHHEKSRCLQLLVSSHSQKVRTLAWAQLDEIKSDIESLEFYLNRYITEKEQEK